MPVTQLLTSWSLPYGTNVGNFMIWAEGAGRARKTQPVFGALRGPALVFDVGSTGSGVVGAHAEDADDGQCLSSLAHGRLEPLWNASPLLS